MTSLEKEQQREEEKKRKKFIWLWLLLIMIGVVLWYFMRQTPRVPLIGSELLPDVGDANDQYVSERAQEIADANYFTLQINPEAVFEDGKSPGSIEIVNPGTNVYPIAVDISLADSEEVIYSSGAIHPNQFVENVQLATPLTEGIYSATAVIHIYDPDTKERQGITEAELTIIVKN
ncbi:hypothetical protein [Enterococcus sp. RIT-PI-f]|uniref:hypothetical protein n=1 Tax=Enterococcus sp. RIT-PI-f TaxID=1690244 RepID=UPI000AF2C823|nr:hypothetical protein [Enterococcus sp. RIT-PI-f]